MKRKAEKKERPNQSMKPTAPEQMFAIDIAPTHLYEVRPRSDKRGVDLISNALPVGRLWYTPSQWNSTLALSPI
jgi:hypothetical protein